MSRNTGADWYSGGEILPSQQAPHSKAPDLSQISCLTGADKSACYEPKTRLRDDSSEFVRISKAGGHKDLLQIKPNAPGSDPVQYDRKSEWYYQDGVDPSESFNGGDYETPNDAKVKRPNNKLRVREEDSDYVKLAKKGGHTDLLVIEENRRSSGPKVYQRSADWYYLEDNKSQAASNFIRQSKGKGTSNPAYNKNDLVDGNTQNQGQSGYSLQPIWLGGSGPEISHVPGKRFMKKEQAEAPFALHTNKSATGMSRNPDKI